MTGQHALVDALGRVCSPNFASLFFLLIFFFSFLSFSLKFWSQKQAVSLRLSSEERCKFIKKTTREEESKTKHVLERESSGGSKSKWTSKSVTTIDEVCGSALFSPISLLFIKCL